MRNSLFLLSRLVDADLDILLREGRRERVAAGAILVAQGQPTAFLDVIVDGAFEVRAGAGGRTVVGRRHRGDVIGEISFLDERPPVASVVALEPSLVLRIPKPRLSACLAADPAFAARFYRAIGTVLAYRLRDLTDREAGAPPGDEDLVGDDVLDGVDLAARRFDQVLARLAG